MNDIPLLFCQPFAFIFGLMDEVNAAAGFALTLLDLIFMLFYLSYDEDLSIDSKNVYEMAAKRLTANTASNVALFSDNISLELDEQGQDDNLLIVENDENGEQK